MYECGNAFAVCSKEWEIAFMHLTRWCGDDMSSFENFSSEKCTKVTEQNCKTCLTS